jgi:hypothetical protein
MMESPYSIGPQPGMGSWRWKRQAKSRYPETPWMWRRDWALGRIRSSSKQTMILAWVFALFWNAVSFPLLWGIAHNAGQGGTEETLMAPIFGLAGIGLLAWAIWLTLHWRKFGMSEFEMVTLPGVIGGDLRGTVHLGTTLQPADGFQVKLVCVNRVNTGGKNSSTKEWIRWQEERHLATESTLYGPQGTAVPIAFTVPYDCEPTRTQPSSDQIIWRLEVRADVPGVDLKTRFEVPVFKTSESSAEVSGSGSEDLAAGDPVDADGVALEEGSRIRVEAPVPGELQFRFPPARNPGVAAGATLFAAIWSGSLVAMVHLGVPILFTVVFGLFDAFLLCFVLALWFGRSDVRVRHDGVELRSRILAFSRSRWLARQDVEEIKPVIGLQTNTTPFYDIQIVRKNGRPLTAARWMRSKREAERVAAAMKQALSEAS